MGESAPVPLDPVALLGDVAIAALASRYGTPLYVIGDVAIRRRVRMLDRVRSSVDACDLYYSLKANPNPHAVMLLAAAGCRFDACSAFDLAVLTELGIPASHVTFCTHALSDSDLDACVRHRVHVVADSAEQIERYRARMGPSSIGLRVNVRVQAGFHPHVQAAASGSRFGVSVEHATRLLRHPPADVDFAGLHCHIGSDVHDAESHLLALDRLIELAEESRSINYVNIGGGYGVPFTVEEPVYDIAVLAEGASKRLDAFSARTGRRLQLRLEPGAFLVRDAGMLVGEVVEVRAGADAQLVLTDTSTNHLPGALLYGSAHPVAAVQAGAIIPDGAASGMATTIVGNLMQPGDVLRRDARLPPLAPGDLVVFGLCGAYTGVRASTFNGRPIPAEVIVIDGQPALSRRRRAPEELVADYDLP